MIDFTRAQNLLMAYLMEVDVEEESIAMEVDNEIEIAMEVDNEIEIAMEVDNEIEIEMEVDEGSDSSKIAVIEIWTTPNFSNELNDFIRHFELTKMMILKFSCTFKG